MKRSVHGDSEILIWDEEPDGSFTALIQPRKRMTNLQGTDVGYTAVRFISRSLP